MQQCCYERLKSYAANCLALVAVLKRDFAIMAKFYARVRYSSDKYAVNC